MHLVVVNHFLPNPKLFPPPVAWGPKKPLEACPKPDPADNPPNAAFEVDPPNAEVPNKPAFPPPNPAAWPLGPTIKQHSLIRINYHFIKSTYTIQIEERQRRCKRQRPTKAEQVPIAKMSKMIIFSNIDDKFSIGTYGFHFLFGCFLEE